MSEYCVVVAERARARLFTLERAEVPEVDPGPCLVERGTLANPQEKAREADIWTDTRRGAHREHQASQRQRQVAAVPHHNYDEHRDQYRDKVNSEFAGDIVAELNRMIRSDGIRRVVLCAEKRMLGYLRPQIGDRLEGGAELEVVAKDLTNLSAHELHDRLAEDGYLPQRRPGRTPTR